MYCNILVIFENALLPDVHVDVPLLIQSSTFLFCTAGLNAALRLVAEPQTKNGKVYWNVVRFDVNVTKLDNFKVKFDNLFNGDEALSKYKKSMQPYIV
jgi:hypothetical protein